jgi:hypothetical protein
MRLPQRQLHQRVFQLFPVDSEPGLVIQSRYPPTPFWQGPPHVAIRHFQNAAGR